MPTTPFVSVVLPVHNGAGLIERALASLRGQTFGDWEAVVVDDASTDATAAVVEAVGWADPRVRAVRHPANRGVAAARNTALRHARGAWVAYLDHDDEYYPDYLGHVARLATGDVLVFRYDIVEERPGRPDSGRSYTHDPAGVYDRMFLQHIAVPLGVAHRRRLVATTGGFDERRRRESDTAMWRRFARAGATFTFAAEKSGRYHVRADSLARTVLAGPPLPEQAFPIPLVDDQPSGVTAPASPSALVQSAPQGGPPAVPPPSAGPRVLFASYHAFHDPTSGAALCTRDLFDLLSARGWACAAFTGPALDAGQEPVERRLAGQPGVTTTGGWSGPVTFRLLHDPAAGYPVSVFSPDPPAARRPPTPAEARAFAGVLRQTMAAFRPDVVLTYGGDAASRTVPALARAAGAASVFWLHNRSYPSAAFFAPYDAVVVPAMASRDHYRAAVGIDPVVLPGPFNWARVATPSKRKYVTFVNPEPAKGVFWFARVLAVLGRRRPDIPVLVVEGRGRVDWLARCGVDLAGVASLRKMANTPDARRFYRLTKVVLMPSLVPEGLPRVAVEAMANGIPVLGSGRGGLAEALGDAGTTLPIPDQYGPDSRTPPTEAEVEPWVQAITTLWDNEEEYARASAAVRAAAEQAWHPDHLAPRWEVALRAIIGRRPAPTSAVLPSNGPAAPSH